MEGLNAQKARLYSKSCEDACIALMLTLLSLGRFILNRGLARRLTSDGGLNFVRFSVVDNTQLGILLASIYADGVLNLNTAFSS